MTDFNCCDEKRKIFRAGALCPIDATDEMTEEVGQKNGRLYAPPAAISPLDKAQLNENTNKLTNYGYNETVPKITDEDVASIGKNAKDNEAINKKIINYGPGTVIPVIPHPNENLKYQSIFVGADGNYHIKAPTGRAWYCSDPIDEQTVYIMIDALHLPPNTKQEVGDILLADNGGIGIIYADTVDGATVEVQFLGQYAKERKIIRIIAPVSATQGYLTEQDIKTLSANESNYIEFDHENYYLADAQHESGYLVYSHVGHDNLDNYFVKCITITLSTRGWVKQERKIIAKEAYLTYIDSSPVHIKKMPRRARSVKVNSISGKTEKSTNLISYPYKDIPQGIGSIINNGITYTVTDDGFITANGTATSNSVFYITKGFSIPVQPNTDYYFSGCPSGGSLSTYNIDIQGFEDDIGRGSVYSNPKFFKTGFVIIIKEGYTANNLVFKPMLTIDGFKPFEKGYTGLHNAKVTAIKGTQTVSISDEIETKPRYGREYTRVDYVAGKYHNEGKTIILTGDEDIQAYTYNQINGVVIGKLLNTSYTRTEGICSDANVSYIASPGSTYNDMWLGVANTSIYWLGILGIWGVDLAGFKAKLKERYNAGNPVVIEYKTKNPVVTPLNYSPAPVVTVSENTELEFVNEHNIDMPNTIEIFTDISANHIKVQHITSNTAGTVDPDTTDLYVGGGATVSWHPYCIPTQFRSIIIERGAIINPPNFKIKGSTTGNINESDYPFTAPSLMIRGGMVYDNTIYLVELGAAAIAAPEIQKEI